MSTRTSTALATLSETRTATRAAWAAARAQLDGDPQLVIVFAGPDRLDGWHNTTSVVVAIPTGSA
jgi:hypothetical protein